MKTLADAELELELELFGGGAVVFELELFSEIIGLRHSTAVRSGVTWTVNFPKQLQ